MRTKKCHFQNIQDAFDHQLNMPEKIYDVAIIGAGPGGLTAAAWCSELGLRAVLIESSSEPGGQLRSVFNPINNYPGISTANGAELASLIETSFSGRNFERRYDCTVNGIDAGEVIRVGLGNAADVLARYVIFATGLSRRKLNIPGEAKFTGKGILRSGAGEKHVAAGKRLVIIGGGDAALENALILAETADSVTIVHRRDSFSAQERFVSGVQNAENISAMMEHYVHGIEGVESVESIIVADKEGRLRTVPADLVLIRIGFKPNSEILAGICDIDDNGFVKAELNGRTSVQNIYAIGDVANPESPTIVTAAGMGAAAARSIYKAFSLNGIVKK